MNFVQGSFSTGLCDLVLEKGVAAEQDAWDVARGSGAQSPCPNETQP